MSQVDGTTPKYEAGFAEAVKRLQGAHPGGWGPTYSAEGALEQALRQAYHAGRMDGITEALGHPDAPGPVNIEAEVPRPTLEEVRDDLGLFEVVPGTTPRKISEALAAAPVLPPLRGSAVVWATRVGMEHLGMSLAEASDWAKGIMQ